MALRTSVTVPVPVEAYDKLHLRELTVRASGEVDDVKFNLQATLRRYARGEDTGRADATGKPIYEKHWMPTDQSGSTITLAINDIEGWALAQATAGNLAAAVAVNDTIGAIEAAIGVMLEVEHAGAVGSVEVV